MKRVLDVGNCLPDHAAVCGLISRHFAAEIVQAHGVEDTLKQLTAGRFDLVLVNRQLDRDGSEGIDLIRRIRAERALDDTPIMMITNFQEHQQRAIAAGAVRGFGKLALSDPETVKRLEAYLAEDRRASDVE